MHQIFIQVSKVAITSTVVALAGCAGTQAEGFRKMSAADHERAAQSGGDQEGVTPGDHLAAAQRLADAVSQAVQPFLHHRLHIDLQQ